MMADRDQCAAHTCRNCGGHASVAITLGGRDRHGHLRTVTAHCSACYGTGTSRPRRTVTSSAAVAA